MIYIVEDDASIRELEQYALQSNGYEVQGFESAEPFWQAMRTAEPELVILDVMLPGEDGFSILKKLRNTPSLRKLPIIMVTAKSASWTPCAGWTAARMTTLQTFRHYGISQPGACGAAALCPGGKAGCAGFPRDPAG